MKKSVYIIMSITIAILVLSVIYLTKKFTWAFGLHSSMELYIVFSFLPLYFITATIAFTNSRNYIKHVLYKKASVFIGFYLFLLLSLLVVDFVDVFLNAKPFVFGVEVLGLGIITTILAYCNAAYQRVTSHTIPMKGLSKTIKAVHLSDIHIGHFRTKGFLDKMIDKINKQNPDVIFITGDYLDSAYALDIKYFNPLKRLEAPVYFVSGNHDHATNKDAIIAMMKQVGVKVLENDIANYNDLQIIGLKHMVADKRVFDIHATNSETVEGTIARLPIDYNKPAVLLHHAPNGIKYAEKAGVNLYLAGHTHAGQIFSFNWIANLMFEYNRGMNDYKTTKVFVSEGIGTFGPPFRVGTKSEIVTLNLIASK